MEGSGQLHMPWLLYPQGKTPPLVPTG